MEAWHRGIRSLVWAHFSYILQQRAGLDCASSLVAQHLSCVEGHPPCGGLFPVCSGFFRGWEVIVFWEDRWCEGRSLEDRVPRLFYLLIEEGRRHLWLGKILCIKVIGLESSTLQWLICKNPLFSLCLPHNVSPQNNPNTHQSIKARKAYQNLTAI